MDTITQYQQDTAFFQRRLKAIQSDIDDINLMYLQAVSQKNIQLAEQCQSALHSAHNKFHTITQALYDYQRPTRKIVQ